MSLFHTRRAGLLMVDIALLLAAGFLAFGLRHNLEFFHPSLLDAWVYHLAVACSAACLIPLFGADRSIWRFSSLNDYFLALVSSFFVIAAACLVTLLVSRFDSVARSIPIIHFVLATSMMVGARVAYRQWHRWRRQKGSPTSVASLAEVQQREDVSVLVVGINRLAEAYIESVAQFGSNQIRVVGLVGIRDRHIGRLISGCPVLGLAEDIETIVRDLEPHGTVINRIVVTSDFDELAQEAREALLKLEGSGTCELQLFAEQLGILKNSGARGGSDQAPPSVSRAERALRFNFPSAQTPTQSRRSYAVAKRCFDATVAFLLLVVLSPAIVVVAIVVGIFIGLPVAFWQQRPGLGGVPFRLYKFRTMRSAHDAGGRLLTDEHRLSKVGTILRRFRLDELPQLFNILNGDMSFVGPRPLLPRDQAPRDCARLLVRPGLTGWAQVIGGRDVSADDKAALDIWYVKNASFILDMKIAIRTVPMILFGETIHRSTIADAWRELRRDGILNG